MVEQTRDEVDALGECEVYVFDVERCEVDGAPVGEVGHARDVYAHCRVHNDVGYGFDIAGVCPFPFWHEFAELPRCTLYVPDFGDVAECDTDLFEVEFVLVACLWEAVAAHGCEPGYFVQVCAHLPEVLELVAPEWDRRLGEQWRRLRPRFA